MGAGLGTAGGGWQWGVAQGTCGVQPLCPFCPCGEPEADLAPSLWLSEVDEEALVQLSVPAELAQKVLQVLEERCQGSALRDLRGSRVYASYSLGRGAEQDGGGSSAVASRGDGCRSTGPEGTVAKAAEEEFPAAAGPPQARSVAAKSDSQLFSELLEREGLLLPEGTEEQSQGNVLPHSGHRRGAGSGAAAPAGEGSGQGTGIA